MYYIASFLVYVVDYDSLLDRYGVFIAKHFADSRIVNIGKSSLCLYSKGKAASFSLTTFNRVMSVRSVNFPFSLVRLHYNAIYPTAHKKYSSALIFAIFNTLGSLF